jgi:beta-barrel assembly-enhancing protease
MLLSGIGVPIAPYRCIRALSARRAFRPSVLVMVFLLVFSTGCATTGPDGEPVRFNLLSTAQEVELGQQLSAEVEKKELVHSDSWLQQYVRDIGELLARQSVRQDVDYRFTVIDNPTTVNAFALPGGHMYVYTGLILLCESEAELAGVMAHEIGHVAGHHHGESLTRQMGAQMLVDVFLGPDAGASESQWAGLLNSVVQLRFSREQELESDRQGMRMMVQAGYNPVAMVQFMESMLQQEQQSGAARPLSFLSSHPATARRVEELRMLLQTYPPEVRSDLNTIEDDFVRIVHPRARKTRTDTNQP